jgi:hypothetical protein
MTRRDILVTLFGTGLSYSAFAGGGSNDPLPTLVSIVRLISEPLKFEGMNVRVIGYLSFNGIDRGLGIYISESDGVNIVIPNSVNIGPPSQWLEKYAGKYVVFNAVFHAYRGERLYSPSGYLDHLTEVATWNSGDIKKI